MTKFICFLIVAFVLAEDSEKSGDTNRQLAKVLVQCLRDPDFDTDVLFDLKKENQVYQNRTTSLVVKYIIKREVDNYRPRQTDAISRKIYSSLIMKLIDIAKDLPRNMTAVDRINQAHNDYMSVESTEMHDKMADTQVFHACARLYDIMMTTSTILAYLGNLKDLTVKRLISELDDLDVKPVHLGVALLIQYHLRSTVNYVIENQVLSVLSTKPQNIGSPVISTLKGVAVHLLPVSELLDVHLAHFSAVFNDTCPSTWLGIVNKYP